MAGAASRRRRAEDRPTWRLVTSSDRRSRKVLSVAGVLALLATWQQFEARRASAEWLPLVQHWVSRQLARLPTRRRVRQAPFLGGPLEQLFARPRAFAWQIAVGI